MATKAWFDYATYMGNKLTQMQALEPNEGWNATKLKAAFEKAGFIGDEGAQTHFLKYGANEDVSPNQYFDADYYYKAKAIQYYTSEAGGSHTEDEVRANLAKYALDVEGLIRKAGMNAWSHYTKYGTAEGINPSDGFNTEAYMQAKLEAMGTGWTMDSLNAAFKKAGLNALAHAMQYGGDSASTATGEVAVWSDTAHTAFADDYNSNDDNIGVTGAAYTLTTAIETINGDTNATVTGIWNNDGAVVPSTTYNTGDKINTAKDVNVTLAKVVNGDAPVVELNNVTNLNVTTLDNGQRFTVNGASFTNVANINVASSTVASNLALTNVELASTIGINSNTTVANDVAVTYRASDVSGDSDIAKFAANNGHGDVTINSNVETVQFTGTGSNAVTFTDASAGDTIKTFTVAGAGENTLNVEGLDNVTKWDMSPSTGGNELNVGAVLDDDAEVIGGSGSDTLGVATATAVKNIKMSGVETLSLRDGGGDATLVFKTATGLTGVEAKASTTDITGDEYTLDSLGSPKTLSYVGVKDKNNTDLTQYFNSITFDGSFTGSEDALAITVANGGVALDKGVGYEIGNLNLKGVETATIAVSDETNEADTVFDQITAENLTSLKVSTSKGSVEITDLVGNDSDGKLATLDFSEVKGTDHSSTVAITGTSLFASSATITAGDGGLEVTSASEAGGAKSKLTFKGSDGDDTLSLANSASAITFTGGDGDDSFTGGSGKAVFTGGAGADSATFGSGDAVVVYTGSNEGGSALKADSTKTFEAGDSITEGTAATFSINVNKVFTKAGHAQSGTTAAIDTTDHSADVWIDTDNAAVSAATTAAALATLVGNVTMKSGDVAWYVANETANTGWRVYEITAGADHDGTALTSSDKISLVGTFTTTDALAIADFDFASL